MKIKLYMILFFLVFRFVLQSCNGQSILSGQIIDGITGEGLSGATISIKKLNLSAASDTKGNYTIYNIPTGEYKVKVSFVGYRDTSASIIIKGTQLVQNFQMITGSVEMSSVVVTATRTEKLVKDIPASVGIVTQEQLQNLPCISADEYLSSVSGVNITRHFGIFYKTDDVTMRGLNRNVHTLLLIDGIPISIVDGGATNWNRVKPENIKKIEVIKGPNSSLYGSNAMGGVVNIITKHPSKPFKGDAGVFYGTYNTTGGSINLNANNLKNDKGFYWNIDGFMRESNGYILMPDSLRDSTDVKTYLREYNAMIRTGYSINKNNSLEIEYDFSDETRGQGKKIYEPDGNYDYYLDHFVQARYRGAFGNAKISAVAFFKSEDYSNQRESQKSNGTYVLFNTASYSDDKGLWCNITFPVAKKHTITTGIDSKLGYFNSDDVYHTSTDTIGYTGNLDFYGLFIQDDFPVVKDKIKVIAGVRYDDVNFYNADLSIKEPSATTEFMIPYLKTYDKKNWQALSPKAGILFDIRNNLTSYISASRGFRSSTLSDLVRTGDVNKGFKLANPYLLPEYISNIEAGFTWDRKKQLTIEPVIFYSIGKDFQYFVGTGDSIYTTKTKKQPVIKRENIGKVEMYGAELGVNFIYNKNLTIFGEYTFNHSVIKKFEVTGYVAKDLNGKFLIDVPMHQVYGGFIYKSKIANLSLTYKYKSSTWVEDENLTKVDAFTLFDGKISKRFADKINASITVENIFNTIYLDSKNMLSPGRFILGEVDVLF